MAPDTMPWLDDEATLERPLAIPVEEQVANLQWLAGTAQGRAVLAQLIFDDCEFDGSCPDAKSAARREVAVRWWSRMVRHCPDQLLAMQKERLERLR